MQTSLLGCGRCSQGSRIRGDRRGPDSWLGQDVRLHPADEISGCRALLHTWGSPGTLHSRDGEGIANGTGTGVPGSGRWGNGGGGTCSSPQQLLSLSRSTQHTTMCSRQDKDQCHRQERYTRQSSGGCHSSGGSGCHSSGGGGCHGSGGGGGCHSSGGGGGCHSSGSGGGCHSSGGSSCHGKPQIQCQQQQQQQQVHQLPSQKLK